MRTGLIFGTRFLHIQISSEQEENILDNTYTTGMRAKRRLRLFLNVRADLLVGVFVGVLLLGAI